MTTEAPDPRTFKSWEDAFNYPVPVVRKLEAQLRASANDNRERLRSLVGASYRDLLGTAERIVEMDQTMAEVEHVLGQIGSRCNSGVVGKISGNYSSLTSHWRSQRQDQNAFASQLAMLQACPTVISRQLKKKASPLLAAKVLVLARLLFKNLAQSEETPPLVERTKNQLGFLRSRLLSRITRQCSDPTVDTEVLIDNMCAYSLVTSSTPTDVLNRFHQIRLDAINSQFDHNEDIQEHVLKALSLCVRTLQDTQSIFPRQLSQALSKLKTSPLLQTSDVRSVTELNLPVHERWIAEEVRNYTPWPRHDELQKGDAERITKTWARQAIAAFVAGLDKVLSNITDIRAVVRLRQEILESWFPTSKRAPGLDPQRVLDDLRDTVNKHLRMVALGDVGRLSSVTKGMTEFLNAFKEEYVQVSPLWELGDETIDLGNGAKRFTQAVTTRIGGRSPPIVKLVDTYVKWADSVGSIRRVIKDMKDDRWDDEFDDDTDDDDDELDLDSKQVLLSEDDPRLLEEALTESLAKAFSDMEGDLRVITGIITSGTDKHRTAKSIFVLRVLREVSLRLPNLDVNAPAAADQKLFPPEAIKSLHELLAESVAAASQKSYKNSLQRFALKSNLPGRQLWEGQPPLPTQPSPAAYKLLHHLMRDMATVGSDLWSPGAVRALKGAMRKSAFDALLATMQDVSLVKKSKALEQPPPPDHKTPLNDDDAEQSPTPQENTTGAERSSTDAASPTSTETDLRRNKTIQLLFDTHYLAHAFAPPITPTETESILSKAQQLGFNAALMEQLARNAAEYWKRTYLVFALLA